MNLRKLHRILGVLIFIFLLNVAITGMMRANAKWLYWTDRPPLTKFTLEVPEVEISKIFEIVKPGLAEGEKVSRVELKPFLGRPVYYADTGKKRILVDGMTGQILSPVTREQALALARIYVAPDVPEKEVKKIPDYKNRSYQAPRAVWSVKFNDAAKTEVVLDQQTGDLLYLYDTGRRFSYWVNRFHELDFLGLSRWFTVVLGTSLVLVALAGFALSLPPKRKPKKN